MTNFLIAIVTSLASGLIGSILTLVISNKNETKKRRREFKMLVFQDLIAYRGDIAENSISTGKFVPALNLVFIAFNDNKQVINAFEKYRNDKQVNSLISLFKEMSKDLSIDYSFANDDLFDSPLIDNKMRIR